jgi:hypothetical protein
MKIYLLMCENKCAESYPVPNEAYLSRDKAYGIAESLSRENDEFWFTVEEIDVKDAD